MVYIYITLAVYSYLTCFFHQFRPTSFPATVCGKLLVTGSFDQSKCSNMCSFNMFNMYVYIQYRHVL